MMKITTISKHGLDYKTVLIYFTGKFPKRCISIKDMTLPNRLFPKANKFIIRCKCDETTIKYMNENFAKQNEIGEKITYNFITENFDKWELASKNVDAMYVPWILFQGMGNTLSVPKIKMHEALLRFSKPIYLFINDVYCLPFKDFTTYINEHNTTLSSNVLKCNTLYSNVNFMPNEQKFTNKEYWWKSKLKLPNEYDINVTQIPESIIYGYPNADEIIEKYKDKKYDKSGIWIGTCFDNRVKYFNKFFSKNVLNLSILGAGSDKVNYYGGDGNAIPHTELKNLFDSHSWTIYIARGNFVPILGATFVEPLLNGLPLFIDYKVADPNKELFPGIKCYYGNENELEYLIENTNLKELWESQVKVLFNKNN